MKRGSTDLSAVLAIDKPYGCTSHDVVNRIRRVTGERRVGHAGTLDPAATGLLVVCIGPATRLSDYIMGGSKTYEGGIAFGVCTDTDDATGEIIATGEVDERLFDETFAAERVAQLVGTFMQTPPSYSAKKRDGRKAYELAREGEETKLDPVEVTVSHARLRGIGRCTGIATDADPLPCWEVELGVSKGTYIRAIARDLGQELGTCATLASLHRTRIGDITIDDAIDLDEFERSYAPEMLAFACIDPLSATGLARLDADAAMMDAVEHGRPILLDEQVNETVGIVADGKLHAIYEPQGRKLVCKAMIPGGVIGVRD